MPPPSPPPSPPILTLEQQVQEAHDFAEAANDIIEQNERDEREDQEDEDAFWEAAEDIWQDEWDAGECPIPPGVRREAAALPMEEREDFMDEYESDYPSIVKAEPDYDERARWFSLSDGIPLDWQYNYSRE